MTLIALAVSLLKKQGWTTSDHPRRFKKNHALLKIYTAAASFNILTTAIHPTNSSQLRHIAAETVGSLQASATRHWGQLDFVSRGVTTIYTEGPTGKEPKRIYSDRSKRLFPLPDALIVLAEPILRITVRYTPGAKQVQPITLAHACQ